MWTLWRLIKWYIWIWTKRSFLLASAFFRLFCFNGFITGLSIGIRWIYPPIWPYGVAGKFRKSLFSWCRIWRPDLIWKRSGTFFNGHLNRAKLGEGDLCEDVRRRKPVRNVKLNLRLAIGWNVFLQGENLSVFHTTSGLLRKNSGLLEKSKRCSIDYQHYFMARNYTNNYLSK